MTETYIINDKGAALEVSPTSWNRLQDTVDEYILVTTKVSQSYTTQYTNSSFSRPAFPIEIHLQFTGGRVGKGKVQKFILEFKPRDPITRKGKEVKQIEILLSELVDKVNGGQRLFDKLTGTMGVLPSAPTIHPLEEDRFQGIAGYGDFS